MDLNEDDFFRQQSQQQQQHPNGNNLSNQQHGASAGQTTTTISTVVVQGGPLQLTIALLQDGDRLHIKVAELLPHLTFLGCNLDDAINLQKQHDELLQKIQGLPSPIEEFYKKVQEKNAANERPHPILIEDMVNSLELVWHDILKILQERRDIVMFNVSFFEKLGECYGKMSALEMACRDTMIPIEIELVREFIEKFKMLRTEVLTSVMSTLKIGNYLLDKLRELTEIGTLDSRPNQIKIDALKSYNQVELWLEDLSDKRNNLELAWQSRKAQLDQCLTLAIMAKELNEIERQLNERREQVLNSAFYLGDSVATVADLLNKYVDYKSEALMLRDKSLKITRTTEELVSTGCFAGDEASAKAYNMLSQCTEYYDKIDHREYLLMQSKDFFATGEEVLIKIKDIVNTFNNYPPKMSAEEKSMMFQSLSEVINGTLKMGYSLVEEFGQTSPETVGVVRLIEELKKFHLELESAMSSVKEDLLVAEALNEFLEQYNNIFAWIMSPKYNLNNFMGNNLEQANEFLRSHHQLLSEIETKGKDINNLLIKLSPQLPNLDDSDRKDIDTKIDSIRKNWIEFKNMIIKRIDLISLYIQFHFLAEEFHNAYMRFDDELVGLKFSDMHRVEGLWEEIKSRLFCLKNVAHKFNEQVLEVADPYLQNNPALKCIENILSDFTNRQLNISNVWESWSIRNEIEVVLKEIIIANMESTTTTSHIEEALYPIFKTDEYNPRELITFILNNLATVQENVKLEDQDLSQRIEKLSRLEPTDQESSDKIVQVKNDLNSIKTRLHTISAEYSELIEIIKSFLVSVNECRENIENYFNDKKTVNADSVENISSNYEMFKNTTMEHFRALLTQSEQIIERIKIQEPNEAKEHDTDRIITLLERLRSFFETQTESENTQLKRQADLIAFDKEVNDINCHISDLSRQLKEIDGCYGYNLDNAKANLQTFDYLGNIIENLNKRIDNFTNTSRNIGVQYPESEGYVNQELQTLESKWKDFKNQTLVTRSNLVLVVQYYEIFDRIEERYRNLQTNIYSVTSSASFLETSNSADILINQIDNILNDNEQLQSSDLKQLSELSIRIYDNDKTTTLNNDNAKLFEKLREIKYNVQDKLSELKAKEEEEVARPEVVTTMNIEDLKQEIIHEIITEIEYEPPCFTQPLCDATIEEGQKFTFECAVTGFPDPEIEWMKDGISIQNNSDYKTMYDKTVCTLTIEETFAADSAQFTCQASNSAGVAETTAKLSVKEIQPEEILAAPSIVKFLENGSAKEGSSHEFLCIVAGNPLPTVQWFKNDVCIDNAPEYNITFNNGEARLTFDEVFRDDQAVYTCKANNNLGAVQCSASLNIEILEQTAVPHFPTPLTNIMARVGQKIKLECEVVGVPKPELTWTHNGKIFSGRDVKLQHENDKVILVIQQAFPKDAGTYIVTAKNSAGEASSSCNVCVKGRLPNETSDSEFASDMEPIKPSVQLPLKDIAVFEGKLVRLDCVIVGQPEPEVIWYHDERPVKESQDFQLLFQGDRCSLLIQEVFLEDAGDYRVVAINSAGEASSSCKLSVTPLNIAEPATRYQQERILPTETPPKFERLLSDILVPEGEEIEFECSLVGDPKPSIKWFFNNKEITDDSRIRSVFKDDGTVKLIIRGVVPDDRGVYTVKASNPSGDAKCFSHLIVKSGANTSDIQQQPTVELEEKFIAPTFKELFTDRTVADEESTKFECIVTGKPTPKIKWFFNDEPVQGRDFLISTSKNRQVLTIPKVTANTVGKISCLAENEVGRSICVANVSLIGDTRFPTESTQSLTQEDNTGSSFITMKKQVFTTTSSSHTSNYENGVPQTQIHSTSSHVDHSFKKIGEAAPEIVESQQFQEYKQVNDLPASMQQKSIINIIKNNVTNESIIANSGQITTGKPVRRNIAPRFVTPLIGKIVDQGADVLLEGIVDGFPTPEVQITKNGELLQEVEGKIKIAYSLNKITIELFNVGVKDAGRYSCTASNAGGSSTSTADLVVKKSIFPPVFGRRLQAQMAKKGERVIMDVEITGTPEPTVTWFKDDRPLDQIMISEFKLQQLGNCYKLILESAQVQDSGKYMVSAKNAGGEAQSIADFAVIQQQPDHLIEVHKTVVFEDMPDFKAEPIFNDKPKETDVKPIISESSHNSHHESSAESKLHGSSESTVITETRRTTEATMRMEHKISFPDFPLTLSQRTQTPTIPCISEGTTMVQTDMLSSATNTDKVPTKSGSTQTAPEVPVKPVRTIEASTSISGFPVTQLSYAQEPTAQLYHDFPAPSIVPLIQFDETRQPIVTSETTTKKSAFEYFENKIATSQMPTTDEKYTKFEDVMKSSQSQSSKTVPSFINQNQNLNQTQQTHIQIQNTWQQPPTKDSHFTSSINDDMLAFNLEPGQPPEIGFMPKIDMPKMQTLKDKVQKLEDIQKQVTDIPTGGVSVFPDYNKFEFSQQQQQQQSQTSFTEIKQDVKYEPIYRPQAESYGSDISRALSPKPSLDSISLYQTSEDFSRTNIARSPSPRPSAEGVAMEKLWSTPKGTDFIYRPKTFVENNSSFTSNVQEYSSVCYNQPAQIIPAVPVIPAPIPVVRQSPALIDFESPVSQVQFVEPPTADYSSSQEEVVAPKQSIKETKRMFEEKIKQNEMPVRSSFMNQTDLKAPAMVKQLFPKPAAEPAPVFANDLNLEPGPPPEICYAPRTVLERKQSYVETMEKTLMKDLEKEPTRVPPGGIRIIPSPIARQPSLPPAEPTARIIETITPVVSDTSLRNIDLIGKPLVLEEHNQTSKTYMESDYESDFDISRNSSTWKPYESDSDATAYAHSTPLQFKPQPFVEQPRTYQSSHFESQESKQESHIVKPKVKVSSGYMADTEEPHKFASPEQFTNNVTTRTFNQTESKSFSSYQHQTQQQSQSQQYYPISQPPMQIPIKQAPPPLLQQQPPPPQQVQPPKPQPTYFKPQQQHYPAAPIKPCEVPTNAPNAGNYAKDYNSATLTKNISMTTKQIRINEETIPLEPMPFKADPVMPRAAKVPPPPSPSKFIKGEFKGSDYESDYEGKIAPIWRPNESDNDQIQYKPVHPVLTPTMGRRANAATNGVAPQPPSQFDNPPQFSGPPRPKFEPIDKVQAPVKLNDITKPEQKQQVFKPKPVNATKSMSSSTHTTSTTTSSMQQQTKQTQQHQQQQQEFYQPQPKVQQAPPQQKSQNNSGNYSYVSGPTTTRYYTAVAGTPIHNAIATETSNSMHMKESTEKSHRVVNITQTRRVINLDNGKSKEFEQLEPFPFSPDPQNTSSPRPRIPPPATPTKFVPSGFRESDYESDVESSRIRARWTPNPSDSDEPHYRSVRAPQQGRSTSVPRSYERVLTPMEFDTQPVRMPTKISVDSALIDSKAQTLDRQLTKKQTTRITQDEKNMSSNYNYISAASSQIDGMNSTFKNKAHQFMNEIMTDVNKQQKPILRKSLSVNEESNAQAYREESRVSQYGTKHVDPDTGIIYFKYDFGYEFGIIFPGEGKKIIAGTRNENNMSARSGASNMRAGAIEIPVLHERTGAGNTNGVVPRRNASVTPTPTGPPVTYRNFQDKAKKRYSLPSQFNGDDYNYQSGRITPKFNEPMSDYARHMENGNTVMPVIVNQQERQAATKPPLFITPLKDIAVVSGQTARFECIVQCEPHPRVVWTKNDQMINNNKYNIEFRNGVCRLTVPQANPDDAGTYRCSATNNLGSVVTTAVLVVPGDKWGFRK